VRDALAAVDGGVGFQEPGFKFGADGFLVVGQGGDHTLDGGEMGLWDLVEQLVKVRCGGHVANAS
jgi:hypothetical protein